MAQYKYAEFLKQSSAPDFDALYAPAPPRYTRESIDV